MAIKGVEPVTGTQMLITAGENPDRMRTSASFAALCGKSPFVVRSSKHRPITAPSRITPARARPDRPSTSPSPTPALNVWPAKVVALELEPRRRRDDPFAQRYRDWLHAGLSQ